MADTDGFCLGEELKEYIAWHLEGDAQDHLGMTTEDYRKSHPDKWKHISWDSWRQMQEEEATESRQAAEAVRNLPVCGEADGGEEGNPGIFERIAERFVPEGEKAEFRASMKAGEICRKRLGLRSLLTPEGQEQFEECAAEEMERLGY